MRALDAAGVVKWASACVSILERLSPSINAINVYPVADGDTGSNLLHTMTGARDELLAESPVSTAGAALAALARGAVSQARGNSGVIFSQILRGFAEALDGCEVVGPSELAMAFRRAESLATEAVAVPMRGTMLTVLQSVSHSFDDDAGSLEELVRRAVDIATDAVEKTPLQLPVLADAGVVDAGGRGLLAVLEALDEVVNGAAAGVTADGAAGEQSAAESLAGAADSPIVSCLTPLAQSSFLQQSHQKQPQQKQIWEVMYLLEDVSASAVSGLKSALTRLGDSVTVAGDGSGGQLVHVHSADIGAAIEAGSELGRVRQIRVEPLPARIGSYPPVSSSGTALDRSVVVVVRDEAVAALVRAEGIAALTVDSPPENPGHEQRLKQLILDSQSGHITVVPADKALTNLAEQVVNDHSLADRDTVVIPCSSPVQVVAALAVHDPSRRFGDDVVAMAEAAAATRRGEVRLAEEESLTWVGRAQAGDLLGLVDGEVAFIEPVSEWESELISVSTKVLRRMLSAGGELVTVLLGTRVPDIVGSELAEYAYSEHPEIEFVSYPAAQQGATVLIGVE